MDFRGGKDFKRNIIIIIRFIFSTWMQKPSLEV